ncbi:MAG: hypothetical protein WBE42_10520 [Pseudolabrys sp.]
MADAFRHTYIPRSWKQITDYARALWAVVRRYIPRSWSDVLDFAHILWVIRIPVCALAVGFALLCLVPQAQDLLVELIEYSWHVVFFLALVFFVWASTTHYTARLLLDTDERFRARVAERNTDFIKGWEILLPRLLGALAFVAVFLSAERSIENLPVIDDPYIVPYVTRMLRWFQVVTLAALGLFIWYLLSRQALSALPPVRTLESKTGFVTRFLRRLGIEPKLDFKQCRPADVVCGVSDMRRHPSVQPCLGRTLVPPQPRGPPASRGLGPVPVVTLRHRPSLRRASYCGCCVRIRDLVVPVRRQSLRTSY